MHMLKCLWDWGLNVLKRIRKDGTHAPEDFVCIASCGINIPVWSCIAESCAWQMASRLEHNSPRPHANALPGKTTTPVSCLLPLQMKVIIL